VTDAKATAWVGKASELEVACVESYYAPRYVVVTTRQDLTGRVVDRRETPMPRSTP
jgi:hypothetical protein